MKGKKVLDLCGRTLLTALIIMGFNAAANAQATYHIGIIGGGQYVNMSWDGPKTVKVFDTTKAGPTFKAWTGKLSYEVGLTQELRLSENFSIQLDAMYSDRGAWHVNSDSSTDYYDKVIYHHSSRQEDFQYIDGHLLFKFNIPLGFERIIPYDRPGKRAFLSLYAGPYFSYLLNYTSTGFSDTLSVFKGANNNRDSVIGAQIDRTTYTKSNFNNKYRKMDPVLSTDLGITVGAGINFLVGESGTFAFDFRYSTGLGNIDNFMYGKRNVSRNDDPGQTSLVYNYANVKHTPMLQFLVSYKIKLLGRGPNTYF
jgi:hypothetical protein